MSTTFQAGIVLAFFASCAAAAQPPAPSATAGERCESAVAETVKRMRGAQAHEIQFIGEKRALAPEKGDETDVKGEGRYRASGGEPTGFTYSCVFNARSGATSGVMFRDTGTPRGAGVDVAWQPDLTRLSPEDCESAAAAALKEKYPRVGRIVFDGEGRRLRPAPNARTVLEGQGAVEPAAGMNRVPFRFRCEFETRSGKVVAAQTTE
jgi:hypothetical protein